MSPRFPLLALALAGTAMLSARADQAQVKLDAENGLWEVTTHGEASGTPAIPEERLQRLTPEQRARIEAAMKGAMDQAMQGRIMRECLTGDRRTRGFDLKDDSDSCRTTVIRNTSTELEIHKDCASGADVHRLTERFQMSGPRHVTGTVDFLRSSGGKALTLHTTFEGKWLGADCRGVKDVQVIK